MKTKGPAQTPSKCRLAVKFARSAPVAILLRRGPTDWARVWPERYQTPTLAQG